MADYDSSLPIRTEAAGDVDIFISDATVSSQKLKVNADGSIDTNVSLPAGTKVEITDGTDDLDINADGSINAVVTATDLDIRDLDFAQDSVDVSGSTNVGVVATDLDIRDLDAAQDSIAAHLKDEDGNAISLDVGNLTSKEIVDCLKRIQSSVNYWQKEKGRQGYLNFIIRFIV
jgi:hypothetical protein